MLCEGKFRERALLYGRLGHSAVRLAFAPFTLASGHALNSFVVHAGEF